MLKWLLEPEIFAGDELLIEALENLGIDYMICDKPYEDYIAENQENCVIFHGSLQFSRLIQRKTQWPLYCNLPRYECLYYYPRFGQYLLNADYVMMPFGDLLRRSNWLFSKIGNSLFIRPSSGAKTFTGEVILDLKNFIKITRVDPESLVVVAKSCDIGKEWRFVVAEDKIIASTQYKDKGEIVSIKEVPEEVINYGKEVLLNTNYQPDLVWTLDICESNGNLKVLEVGSFSCAGIYACDPEPIIQKVNEISLREWEGSF